MNARGYVDYDFGLAHKAAPATLGAIKNLLDQPDVLLPEYARDRVAFVESAYQKKIRDARLMRTALSWKIAVAGSAPSGLTVKTNDYDMSAAFAPVNEVYNSTLPASEQFDVRNRPVPIVR